MFKAIYDPKAGLAGVYLSRNAPGWHYWTMTLDQFRSECGIEPFPGVPPAIAQEAPDLPRPIKLRHADD